MEMKKFYVFWTYMANYGGPWEREGKTAEEVAKSIVKGFIPDFSDRGKVYVFDSLPAFTYSGEKL